MAKKKKNPKKNSGNKGFAAQSQRRMESTYTTRKNALNRGQYVLLAAGCLMLLLSFILSLTDYSFLYKQPVVFLLMGVGCAILAYLQDKTIRLKGGVRRTGLFWVMASLAVLYLIVGIYTFFSVQP